MDEPLTLGGCRPEPVMGYLKALGVFRLVTEQADASARMSWDGGTCQLYSTLDRDSLSEFFLDLYRPTPVLAPWNGGSGFYGGGSEPLDAIAGSTGDRLALYRNTIAAIRSFIPAEKPKDERKADLLLLCQAVLPDEVIPWLDACFVLRDDGPSFFPLLGTGGNDGRLEFTNNFMQRLVDVIPFCEGEPPADSGRWLASALFADALVPLRKTAIGQFNPGGIGGANGAQGKFEADSRVNPWDFVLMIEGTTLFAGSVARRLGANAATRAAFPFSVRSVAVGYGSATASEETTDGSRDELWLPLWDRPATLAEVKHLFAEGRAQIGRRQARNAVEFSLAVSLLGVDRGITSFARYGFLKRNGLAFLATPLGRVQVKSRPNARLLDDPPLTDWLEQFRRACRDKEKAPARYQTALRQVDRAIFEFSNRSERGGPADRRGLVGVLVAIGRAEQTLACGLSFCKDKRINPIQGWNPDWLLIAKDGGDEWREFRLAAALASVLAERKAAVGSIRTHLEPVESSRRAKGRIDWQPGSVSSVWTDGPLADNLAAVFLRRFMESERDGLTGIALRARVTAPLSDVIGFLTDPPGPGQTARDNRLANLLWGLIAIGWDGKWFKDEKKRHRLHKAFRATPRDDSSRATGVPRTVLPWEFGILRLVAERVGFAPDANRGLLAVPIKESILKTTPVGEPFHRLARARSVPDAIALARRRLWADQLPLSKRFQRDALRPDLALDPLRLLAACLFPLSSSAKSRLVQDIISKPGSY